MSENSWNLTLLTDRLILRPQQPSYYEAWYAGFSGRSPKQHSYDEGIVDLEGCDREWFRRLCDRHQRESYVPSIKGTLVYFSTNSIDDTLDTVNVNGSKTLYPKTSIGKLGWVAEFEDSEGNRIALHSQSA